MQLGRLEEAADAYRDSLRKIEQVIASVSTEGGGGGRGGRGGRGGDEGGCDDMRMHLFETYASTYEELVCACLCGCSARQFTCFTGAKVQMLTRLRRQHLEHYIERMPLRTEDRKIQDWKGEMDKVSALLLTVLALFALVDLLALLVQMYHC